MTTRRMVDGTGEQVSHVFITFEFHLNRGKVTDELFPQMHLFLVVATQKVHVGVKDMLAKEAVFGTITLGFSVSSLASWQPSTVEFDKHALVCE